MSEKLDHAGRKRANQLSEWDIDDLAHHCAFVEQQLKEAGAKLACGHPASLEQEISGQKYCGFCYRLVYSKIAKRELMDGLHSLGYEVIAVFEDRPSVVRIWRDMGLTVFQLTHEEF